MKAKNASKAVAIIVLIAISISSCATAPVNYNDDDPFGPQLEHIYYNREVWTETLTWSVIATAAGFLTATTSMTLSGLEMLDPGLATALTVSGYTVSVAGAGLGVTAFIQREKYTDQYLELLRRSTHYWNLVR
jgi:hypothetical protein